MTVSGGPPEQDRPRSHDDGGTFRFALHCAELAEGAVRTLTLDGTRVALFRIAGQIYATSSVCPHAAGPLGEGDLVGPSIVCPYHGWEFDVPTGVCRNIEGQKLETFPVRVTDGRVLVRVR